MAKEKPKNWPHQILDFLYQHYSETTTDLRTFCTTTLGINENDRIKAEKIRNILNALEEKNLITWQVAQKVIDPVTKEESWPPFINYKQHFGLFLYGVEHTFKENRVEAQLTLEGLKYAIELRREKQKHQVTMITSPLSVIFAALAFSVSLLTFLRGCDDKSQCHKELLQSGQKPHIDTWLLQKSNMDSQVKKKIPKTSLQDSAR